MEDREERPALRIGGAQPSGADEPIHIRTEEEVKELYGAGSPIHAAMFPPPPRRPPRWDGVDLTVFGYGLRVHQHAQCDLDVEEPLLVVYARSPGRFLRVLCLSPRLVEIGGAVWRRVDGLRP